MHRIWLCPLNFFNMHVHSHLVLGWYLWPAQDFFHILANDLTKQGLQAFAICVEIL